MSSARLPAFAAEALELIFGIGAWMLFRYLPFRLRLQRDHGIHSLRPYRWRHWHLGSKYFRGVTGARTVFVKVAAHRAMIENEVAARRRIVLLDEVTAVSIAAVAHDVTGADAFFAVPWVEAPRLDEFLERPAAAANLARLAPQLVTLVDQFFSACIIHRDLTPRNILVGVVEGEHVLIPIDFAFAHVAGEIDRDRRLPTAALRTLGEGYTPAPHAWDDAFAALRILDLMEAAQQSTFDGVRGALDRRVGRRTLVAEAG